jgi:hypothetical protein
MLLKCQIKSAMEMCYAIQTRKKNVVVTIWNNCIIMGLVQNNKEVHTIVSALGQEAEVVQRWRREAQ